MNARPLFSWTPELVTLLRTCIEAELSRRQCAEHTGAPISAVEKKAEQLGLKWQNQFARRLVATPAQIDEAKRRRAAGESWDRVCAAVGVGELTIRRAIDPEAARIISERKRRARERRDQSPILGAEEAGKPAERKARRVRQILAPVEKRRTHYQEWLAGEITRDVLMARIASEEAFL